MGWGKREVFLERFGVRGKEFGDQRAFECEEERGRLVNGVGALVLRELSLGVLDAVLEFLWVFGGGDPFFWVEG